MTLLNTNLASSLSFIINPLLFKISICSSNVFLLLLQPLFSPFHRYTFI
nr:MAG TPA: hypothetical protein [Caudoviricetes sp.]